MKTDYQKFAEAWRDLKDAVRGSSLGIFVVYLTETLNDWLKR